MTAALNEAALAGSPGTGDKLCCACRYVEIHMEQGPVLESRGYAVGPVAAIAGQTRLSVSVEGTQVSPCSTCHVSTPSPPMQTLKDLSKMLLLCSWPAVAETADIKLAGDRICC